MSLYDIRAAYEALSDAKRRGLRRCAPEVAEAVERALGIDPDRPRRGTKKHGTDVRAAWARPRAHADTREMRR